MFEGTPHRVRWNLPECSKDTNSIEFDGVPFIVVGKLVLECHQGKEKTRKAKQAQQLNDDHGSYKKKRFLVQPSKKIGCPAQVIMREVIRFDQFKVSSNSIWRKEEASKLLRQCLSTVEDPTMDFQRRIYVTLPTVNEHKFHVTGETANMTLPTDERVIGKIVSLVREGVNSVNEVKRHVSSFVKNELFRDCSPPPVTNKRFYPSKTDIRNHVYKTRMQQVKSKVDQVNLSLKITEWKEQYSEDKFYFRSYSDRHADTNTQDEEEDDVVLSGTNGLFLHINQNGSKIYW
ncbi:calcium-responsive transcription factor-like [Ptychodera flava]|uniref:calcium-responsive transcription factor-like n=1 Tax=Ptychodera flava TaxID=63121 RepID=UPI00396A67E4